MAILTELRSHFRAEADVVREVFDTRRPEQWTDEGIVAWRRKQLRLGLIQDYGEMLARRFLGEGGTPPPPDSDPLPIPYSTIVRSDEERVRFRTGFFVGAHFGKPIGLDYPGWSRELAELERRLGSQP